MAGVPSRAHDVRLSHGGTMNNSKIARCVVATAMTVAAPAL